LLIVIKFKINLVLILDTQIKNKKMLQNLNLIINSPLEQFEVSSLISVIAPIFGYINITLSNLGLYSILILFIILSLHIISNNENKILPSKWSIAIESIFTTINTMVREQLGKEIYLPFIYSLFFFYIN